MQPQYKVEFKGRTLYEGTDKERAEAIYAEAEKKAAFGLGHAKLTRDGETVVELEN